ncbi:MAG: hypothetical protein PHI12_04510 [Dehalococcoidales bacterium]|nr:hypothetical protein [Dehalococcoidales bacterium]
MLTDEQFKYMRNHGLTWRDLYDFPMSWDWWRHYSVYNTGTDPGPNKIPQRPLVPVPPDPSEAEARHHELKEIREDIHQLRMGLRYTQKLQQQLQQKIQAKSLRTRGITKGVPL